MSFDISNLHIADDSPEGRVLEAIVNRDQITPEEAIRRVLREMDVSAVTPAEQMWGAFSSPEDAAVLDQAMKVASERRQYDEPRDLGL